ncbi:MAG: HNH endonuclease [Chloroflexi bacterium]|nr:HNH endonuclease [Chloroflexota bacterium]
MQVAEVELAVDKATLRLDTITLRNQMFEADELHLEQRLAALKNVWDKKTHLPDDVAVLLAEHESSIQSPTPVGTSTERVVTSLEELISEQASDLGLPYSGGTDVLQYLTQVLELEVPEPLSHMNDIDPEEPELRRRVIREWKRWANSRGAASAKFRALVRKAYNSTCAVCGRHLPATKRNRLPGVDAAHILPWSEYELDVVFNGICLCKLHHWAFDEGLIRITANHGQFSVEVPGDISDYFIQEVPAFSLECLKDHIGPIPEGRLPVEAAARPNQSLLQQLNQELDMI